MTNDNKNEKENRKSNEKIALISGFCVIIAAMFNMFNINIENKKLQEDYEKAISENTQLNAQINNSQEVYDNLNNRYEILENQNNEFQARISSLENELSQYSSIGEENSELKSEIQNLQNEIKDLRDNYKNQEDLISNDEIDNNQKTSLEQASGKKISIFDLNTKKGDGGGGLHFLLRCLPIPTV